MATQKPNPARGDDFTVRQVRFKPRDPRLGRHVLHDSRSLRFLAPRRDVATLRSVRHEVNIPILDQGDLGSCTGHAGTNLIASAPFWSAGQGSIGGADPHLYAVRLYGDATRLDPWPGEWEPDDTGSDGLSVAKVLHARGLISGYQHATSLEAALAALAERPVMIGSSWLRNMSDPGPDGHLRVSGVVDGGHEYALDELDVERRRVWMRQTWGPDWGQSGRAWMTWDELGRLLADDGDCTVPIPLTEPAPVPAPVAPPPPPTSSAEELALAHDLDRFVDNRGCPVYLRKSAAAWRATLKGVKP